MIWLGGFSARLCHPSTLRMTIWPRGEQRPEQHGGGFGAGQDGLRLDARLKSSCRRSIAFEVLIDFHWLGEENQKFVAGLKQLPGVIGAVVLSRPGKMGRSQ